MPQILFKGKQFIQNYHLGVKFHELVTDKKKSFCADGVGVPGGRLRRDGSIRARARQSHHTSVLVSAESPERDSVEMGHTLSLHDNLIVHGDNLKALKALLPTYAGKVKCVYIDPPYNTGNEKWVYNDNVNSPMIKEWLGKIVDIEDLTRHEKWLCMMMPRLKLLRELLRDDGVIFISIDDNEVHHLRMLMDEIFGEENFVAEIIWHAKYTLSNDAKYISRQHEYILVYAKSIANFNINLLERTEEMDERYSNPDHDSRGNWKLTPLHAKSGSGESYIFTFKNGLKWKAPQGRFPRFSIAKLKELDIDNRIYFGRNGKSIPGVKTFLSEVQQGKKAGSIWSYEEIGSTHQANEQLSEFFGKGIFENPKNYNLIKRCIQISTDKDSIILDSFAGSGTTAHAVLALNKEDSGNRKFILVECEDYADKITAERVRRVMSGVKNAKDEKFKKRVWRKF
ncbi:hypothetical protein A2Y83_00315 [Candidatus Falkowbacteria bacterium RBG_13_39_14]|uniref:DNA methylase N-4/N-6 domain-containing protein n=1 Tax=Candidatus Falkowbacteria bacterium RBG_13_39_14 TaxID=1797985 RepID=A0A1F5S449_9BACT|nr:MAG: hypothetical protein A2Y83_00315 [Candidatus Falkowbacteria bacterium RBG_13_39_14]